LASAKPGDRGRANFVSQGRRQEKLACSISEGVVVPSGTKEE